jgi:hypothetical protein
MLKVKVLDALGFAKTLGNSLKSAANFSAYCIGASALYFLPIQSYLTYSY